METCRLRHKPRRGRELKVEKLEASLDFKSYYENLGVEMSGHTQSHSMNQKNIEACHVWRFCKRRNIDFDGAIATSWPDEPEHPDDVLLMVKHALADGQYCQDPIVFCPHVNYLKLPKEGPMG